MKSDAIWIPNFFCKEMLINKLKNVVFFCSCLMLIINKIIMFLSYSYEQTC